MTSLPDRSAASITFRKAAAGLVLGLAACSSSDGQQPESVSEAPQKVQRSSAPFCLSLSTARTQVLLGEPLTLFVELTNCSSSTQSVRDLLPVEFGLLSVWKRGPGSKGEELYYSPVRREGRGRRSVDVPPGGALTSLVPVYLDSTGWNLTETGDYQFRAQYQVLETVLDAEPVKVRVSAPKGELVAAARDFMRPQAARFFLLEGGDAPGRDIMLSISSRFPRSPWASYAELSLAIDDTASAAQARKLDNCKRLDAATRQVPDWIVALRGYRALFNCLRETGQAESAREIAQDLIKRNPRARNARELRIE